MAKEKLHAADIDEILSYVLDLEGNEEDDVMENALADKYNISIDDFQEIVQKLYDAIDISCSQLTGSLQMGFGDGALWMAKKDITSKFINVLIQWMGPATDEKPKWERVITKEGKPDFRIVMEKLSGKPKPKTGISIIAEERKRQKTNEGYSAEHDDEHDDDELSRAAAFYAIPVSHRPYGNHHVDNWIWPWDSDQFKPTPDNRIKELAKSGALIAAEIERLLRKEASNG